MKIILMLSVIAICGCSVEQKYRDCSDLLIENSKLKEDLRVLKIEFRKEVDFNSTFKHYWWNRINEHNAVCTNSKIGPIGKIGPTGK